MKRLNLSDVYQYVEENISTFHTKRISSLDTLSLSKILHRKNPYLFKSKYLITSEQIVKGFIDAHISSNEETIFGDWLEGLAIFINSMVYGGKKSGIVGIDLEFDKNDRRYIVSIKSGPNWGNSSQIQKMINDFKTATRTLRTTNYGLNVISVNGCCYGQDNKPDKGIYFKYCGQLFWEFISGNPELYTDIIEPLGHHARTSNDEFQNAYAQMVNKFTTEFSLRFCDQNGSINWQKMVQFNSSKSDNGMTII